MQKQSLTQDEFTKKLTEELTKAGKASPKDVIILDKEGADTDPIGYMMRNIMRIELVRMMFLRDIYQKFKENNDKRATADLIISSSRHFAATMLMQTLIEAAGKPEDLEKFAFIVGVDPQMLKKGFHEKVSSNPNG